MLIYRKQNDGTEVADYSFNERVIGEICYSPADDYPHVPAGAYGFFHYETREGDNCLTESEAIERLEDVEKKLWDNR